MNLSFGYLYDFRNPQTWHRPPADLYAETLEFITWSETVGFQGAWVPEHHVANDGYMPSPLVALSAIAARTKTMRIGSGIALAPLYHPVRFAEDCAVLDAISGGRLAMGLAIGYRKRETAAYGIDFTKRGAIFDEFLEIVTRLWAGETVNFAGKHFAIESAFIQPRPASGRIPLYIGGFAPKALERVARYGTGYFGNEEFVAPYKEALIAQGKDPAKARVWIQSLFTVVADDPEAAMEELAHHFLHANNSYGAWLNEDKASGIDGLLKPMSLDDFKASGTLQILTPGEAIAHFKAMQSRIPVEHVMFMLPPGIPPMQFAKYADVFAKKVIPAFA